MTERNVFTCTCGHRTSVAAFDTAICNQCWELAGICCEWQSGSKVEKAATIEQHKAAILANCEQVLMRGGTLSADNNLLYAVATMPKRNPNYN